MENAIWTEKYRPQKLADVVGQKHITERLEAFVARKSLPHCLFAGPSGCGKSTTAICIAKGLFGGSWRGNFLETNASDERGIDTIRVKIKDFARTISMENSFKIIFLDEADSLTRDAQHALRRIMERYSDTARFILSANYSSKIILPIQSRTAVFRFAALKEDDVAGFLKCIASSEHLDISDAACKSIVYISEGDMRKAVNILQSAAVMGGKISTDTILSVTSRADPSAVLNMLAHSLRGDFNSARGMLRSLMIERGLSGEDIIKEIHNQIYSLDIDDFQKVMLLEKVGEYEFRLTEGSNARIQLEALLAQLMLAGKK